jgi:hypothetical protein
MSESTEYSVLSDSKVRLETLADWTQFEASLLTIGLFEHFPLPSIEKTLEDDNMTKLWRAVVTRALFDCLRGPTVDASPPPSDTDSPSYPRRIKHYKDVVLKRSKGIYTSAIHWLYEGKSVSDWLDKEGSEIIERDSDFVMVCDLASLDPSLVKQTFLRLMKMKASVTP